MNYYEFKTILKKENFAYSYSCRDWGDKIDMARTGLSEAADWPTESVGKQVAWLCAKETKSAYQHH